MPYISLEWRGPVVLVTFSNPPVNSLPGELTDELGETFARLSYDENIRAAVIMSPGEKAFGAGADIGWFSQHLNEADGRAFSQRAKASFQHVAGAPFPVIAAMTGFAFGGGLELALACDLRILSDRAKVGLPEVTLGVIAGDGGSQRLPRLIGAARAKDMLFTGRHVGAEEALEMGIVNRLAAPDQVLTAALELAEQISKNAPLAVRASKRAINEGMALPLEEAFQLESELEGMLFATADAVEGTEAFKERRQPDFQGR